jgi:hypothetical protein
MARADKGRLDGVASSSIGVPNGRNHHRLIIRHGGCHAITLRAAVSADLCETYAAPQ